MKYLVYVALAAAALTLSLGCATTSHDATTRAHLDACDQGSVAGCREARAILMNRVEIDPAQINAIFERECALEASEDCAGWVRQVVPALAESYLEECRKDDGLACLKHAMILARQRGWDPEPTVVCNGEGALAMEDAEAHMLCAQGQATACWVHGSNRRAAEPSLPPSLTDFAIGGFDVHASDLIPDHRACSDGDLSACIGVANDIASTEPERAERLLQASCDADVTRACHVLARHLANDPARLSEAAAQYIQTCELGYWPSCEAAALIYRDGDGVPTSRGCAVYFAWQACTGDVLHCGTFENLFPTDAH